MYERIVSCSKLTSVQISGSTTRQLGVHSHNNMRHAIKETLVGTTVLATTVLFMAAAVIALYKAAGM